MGRGMEVLEDREAGARIDDVFMHATTLNRELPPVPNGPVASWSVIAFCCRMPTDVRQ